MYIVRSNHKSAQLVSKIFSMHKKHRRDVSNQLSIRVIYLDRVPTGLESRGKPGKIKWSGKVRELIFEMPIIVKLKNVAIFI